MLSKIGWPGLDPGRDHLLLVESWPRSKTGLDPNLSGAGDENVIVKMLFKLKYLDISSYNPASIYTASAHIRCRIFCRLRNRVGSVAKRLVLLDQGVVR